MLNLRWLGAALFAARIAAAQTAEQLPVPRTVPPNFYRDQLRILTAGVPPSPVKDTPPAAVAPPVKPQASHGPAHPAAPAEPPKRETAPSFGSWRSDGLDVPRDASGRAIYVFGSGMPTLVCPAIRLCTLELQAGELPSDPQVGDSERWPGALVYYGTGGGKTAVFVMKPKAPGLETNMVVTTDRRAYYIRLVSSNETYIARLAFRYPEDEAAAKAAKEKEAADHARAEEDRLKAEKARAEHPILTEAPLPKPENVRLTYSFTTPPGVIAPVRVYDDGAKTYIEMPAAVASREMPVLYVIGRDDKGEMTNYRVQNGTFIVDRLFDKAQLIAMTGKKKAPKSKTVIITRNEGVNESK